MIKVIRDQGAPITAAFKDISPNTVFVRNETAGAFVKVDDELAFVVENAGGKPLHAFNPDDIVILCTAELHITIRRRKL